MSGDPPETQDSTVEHGEAEGDQHHAGEIGRLQRLPEKEVAEQDRAWRHQQGDQ
ncbi:hypothetical protein D3C86_2267150 [compost metagenome]